MLRAAPLCALGPVAVESWSEIARGRRAREGSVGEIGGQGWTRGHGGP